MYLFKNEVFVKTTFIYLMGLLFPNATFIYFLRLLHSTFITTPHLLPHLFPISHANERGVVIFRPTHAAQDRRQTGTPIYLYHQYRHKFTQHSTLLTIFKSHLIFAAVG